MLKSLAAKSVDVLRDGCGLAEVVAPLMPLLGTPFVEGVAFPFTVPLALALALAFPFAVPLAAASAAAAAAATAGGYDGSRFQILAVWSAEQVAKCLTSGDSSTRVR